MTKLISITPTSKDFGSKNLFTSNDETFTLKNTGTEIINVTDVISDNEVFSVSHDVTTLLPANSNIYLNCNGGLSTVDSGCGIIGTTDDDGQISVSPLTPTLTLDSPLESAKFELDETITAEWTANNISLINIVIESATGIKTVEDVDATLGTYDVDLTADTGDFEVNQEITITVKNVIGAVADDVAVSSIATLTMTTPVLTAGVEGTIELTHNGGEGYFVQVQSRVSDPEGAWEIFEDNVPVEADNTCTATGTIADAGTRDFRARDTVDPDGQIQLDDVVVASGDKYMVYSFSGSVLYADEFNGTSLTNRSSIDLTTNINYISKYKTNNTDYIYALDNDGYIALIKYSSGSLSKIGEIALSGSDRVYGYHVSGTRLFVSRYDGNLVARSIVDYSLSSNALGALPTSGPGVVGSAFPYGVIVNDEINRVASFASNAIYKGITYNPADNSFTKYETGSVALGDLYYGFHVGNQISGNTIFTRLGKVLSYDFTAQTLGTALDITTVLDYYSVPVSSDTVLVCDRTNGYIYRVSFNSGTKTLSKDAGYNTGLALRSVDYSTDLAVICSSTHLRFIKADYSDAVNIETVRTRALISKIED
jgi:hypothetical protein